MQAPIVQRRAALCLVAAAFVRTSAEASVNLDVSPTMERPALHLRQPQRAAILATARVGRRVVAVGERGVVLWSDDDGRSWHQAMVPVSVTLTSVSFVGEHVGWAAGHGAVILHTTDGGINWTRQYDGKKLAQAAMEKLTNADSSGQGSAADAVPGLGSGEAACGKHC